MFAMRERREERSVIDRSDVPGWIGSTQRKEESNDFFFLLGRESMLKRHPSFAAFNNECQSPLSCLSHRIDADRLQFAHFIIVIPDSIEKNEEKKMGVDPLFHCFMGRRGGDRHHPSIMPRTHVRTHAVCSTPFLITKPLQLFIFYCFVFIPNRHDRPA